MAATNFIVCLSFAILACYLVQLASFPPILQVKRKHTDTLHEPIEELSAMIDHINESMPNAIITGDFNVPSVNWKSKTISPNPLYRRAVNQAIIDMTVQNGLQQVQHKPSRQNNILDLVFVNNPNIINSTLAVKQNIPEKTLGPRRDVPWMTPNVKRMIKKKQRLYNLQRKSRRKDHKANFMAARRAVKKALNTAHNEYVMGLLDVKEKESNVERFNTGRKF
ncbi:predicted protein [Nematostella vectensis]|uniref:Endonuclease/exonuclease/phosphatase domain-containing protein n=1 Tax=Nematostella vectensis TaxID=45351 RepID=A7SAZ4_NEMVE|nr:predicted protein [Nematostella vectensis]|eukprot:XP_001631199.1 predicted protein [Nematostella vectensis]